MATIPEATEASVEARPVRDIFISYSTKDAAVAEAARAAIEAKGIRCWIAPRDISPGMDWSAAIIDAIEECSIFVLIFSSASNDSEQVKREVQNAVSQRLPILPFRIEDVPLSKPMRYFIGTPHWLDALAPPLERNLERLVEAVQRLLASNKPSDGSSAPTNVAPMQRLEARPHNLPQHLTSFIGRDKERAQVREQLSDARLVSLLGAGGCGKTRLAIQTAFDLLDEFEDGVWLVELEALSASSLVAQTVAAVLNVREEAEHALLDTLAEQLSPKHLLLILDNCEHVVGECARLAETLLRACPQLRILTTSREALGIAGEVPWRVPSLALPDLARLPSPEVLGHYEVVQLFVDRAQTQVRGFALNGSNALAVAQICHRLDGIPLAIELAAARVKMMTPEKIAQRLDDRFRLLKGGSRTALPRQQTLEAAIDWSYNLLEDEERIVLHRLSVFAGGWEMEAAEAVCVSEQIEDYEVLDYLSQLVDKSLVMTSDEDGDGERRYRMLESVREYSRNKLEESGETQDVRARHAQWYSNMAQEAAPKLEGVQNLELLDRLEIEQANLRAALDWLLMHGAAEESARMCIALAGFWERRGWFSESRASLERCLLRQDEIEDLACRVKLLATAGWFPYLQGDYDEAARHQQASLELSREMDDTEGEAAALNHIALIAFAQGRATEAREAFESSLALVRALKDPAKLAMRLSNLALLEIQEGQHERAHELLEEALAINKKRRDTHGTAGCLCNLAELALHRHNWVEAGTRAQQALELFRQLKDQRGIAYSLANLAEAATHRAEHTDAEHTDLDMVEAWLREATSICRDTGMYWMVPSLLETRARSYVHSSVNDQEIPGEMDGMHATALFSLAAAEHLRDQLSVPRTGEEQHNALEMEAVLHEALGQEVIETARADVRDLEMDEIIARVMQENAVPARSI